MAIYAKRGFPVQRDLSKLDLNRVKQEERPVAEKKKVEKKMVRTLELKKGEAEEPTTLESK